MGFKPGSEAGEGGMVFEEAERNKDEGRLNRKKKRDGGNVWLQSQAYTRAADKPEEDVAGGRVRPMCRAGRLGQCTVESGG